MAQNPDFLYEVTYLDRSGEKSNMKVHYDDAAVDLATKLAALVTAANTLSLMVEQATNMTTVNVITNARVGAGQREGKYLVEYQDNTNLNKGSFTIPGRDDNTYTTEPGTDYYDLTTTDLAALVTAVQAVVVSPDGNAITVTGIKSVGRNI